MSIPANKADTQGNAGKEPTFADAVNKAVEAATVDAKGNLVLPEGLDEATKYAATAEKRRRDTQSAWAKDKLKLKAAEAEKSVLLEDVLGTATIELTQEQADELEELKFSDPEAWRKKINSYEGEGRKKKRTSVDEKLKKVSTSTLEADEIEQRAETLKEFTQKTGLELDDDIIANDIPPRITKKLADGKISFEDFLQECSDYLKTGKVAPQEKSAGQPNLNKVGGGNNPDPNAVKEDIKSSYSKETY